MARADETTIHVPKWLWSLLFIAVASQVHDSIQITRLSEKLELVNATAIALQEVRAEQHRQQVESYKITRLSEDMAELRRLVEKLRDELIEVRHGDTARTPK